MLLVGRFILGLAVGAASVSVPLMVSEISPPEIRGQIGVLNQLGITFGMLLAYALGTGFSFIPPPDNWRVMFGFPIIFCLVHVVIAGIFVRAESPRWLVMRSKFADARTMLKWLRRTDNIEGEMKELQAVAGDGAQTHTMSLREQIGSLFVPFRPVCIAVGLMFLQQITGINAVMYYLTPFLRNAGMSETLADEMGIVVGVVNVLMTIISVALIDRLGRKPLLLMSFSGMTVSLALIGVFSFVTWLPKITASVTSIIFTVTFVMCFAIGLGPVPWCMVSEIFPSQISALAVSISLVTNWGTNLLVSMTFLYLMKALGVAVVFWIFSGLSVVGILFSLFVAIETKGRSVEDIVQSLSGNKEK
jgi:sugar porter (SP) family MFS transporter